MSLNKEFLSRPTNITAKVICDSISESGVRITTLEVEAPRIILAEINTHNAISKNCSSSRAIPISKMLSQIGENGFTPLKWGSKQSGMQSGDELSGLRLYAVKNIWYDVKKNTIDAVKDLDNYGLHKEISNRLSEPFQMVKQVLTATDWDNFFNLRLHKDSQPEICMLAYKIYKAMEESKPNLLRVGEYHLPYIDKLVGKNNELLSYGLIKQDSVYGEMHVPILLEEAIKYSVARCASVSYRTESMTLEKSQEIYARLLEADVLHSSPAEHIATPIPYNNVNDTQTGYDTAMDNLYGNTKGITHINAYGDYCSANFRGWIQYRHLLKGNTCYSFDFEERMKMFE